MTVGTGVTPVTAVTTVTTVTAPLQELLDDGWLFTPSGPLTPTKLLHLHELPRISIREVIPDLVGFLSYSLICILALVHKTIAVESRAKCPLDINRELQLAGIANMLSGGCGGLVASHSATYVAVLRQARIRNRRAAGVTQLATAVALISGWPLMNILPRFLLGGLLMALGESSHARWHLASRPARGRGGRATLVCGATARRGADVPRLAVEGAAARG